MVDEVRLFPARSITQLDRANHWQMLRTCQSDMSSASNRSAVVSPLLAEAPTRTQPRMSLMEPADADGLRVSAGGWGSAIWILDLTGPIAAY
jgi:hypothetical protein